MKKFIILFVLASTFFMLNSCDKILDGPDFTFPLQVGNSWEYTRIHRHTKVDSDSLSSFFSLSDTSNVTMRIKGTKTFADTAETYEFVSELVHDNIHFISSTFYRPLRTGLYRYAYLATGGATIFPKQGQTGTILFQGKTYAGVFALSQALLSGSVYSKTRSDSLNIENPAPLVYKYPFKVGDQWTFIRNNDFYMAKRVSGKGKLELESGVFSCYKIEWLYDWDEDGDWDDDISFIDYVSKEGLIFRKLSFFGIVYTNQNGEELGSFDSHEEFILTQFSL